MPITDSQAIQSILKPTNGPALRRAADDNDRQRYHTGPATSEVDAGPYALKLKERVKGILQNQEKFDRFCTLLNYPLPSSRLIDKGADEYLKAFNAEDRFVDYNFNDDEIKNDARAYLDEIGFEDFLQTRLFNQCLRASSAVWVVDLPAIVNETGFAEPVVFLREVVNVTDIQVNQRGIITALIFPMSPLLDETGKKVGKRWAVLDDASYRVFVQPNGKSRPSVSLTNYHNLKRCPSGWIWHDNLIDSDPIRKQSPLHALFTDLDKLVISDIFSQHADLYASFPILWSYKTRCNYTPTNGEPCDNGLVRYYEPIYEEIDGLKIEIDRTEKIIPCPMCARKKPIGPGSQFTVPQPQGADSPDLSNPVGFVNAEVNLLEYNVDKIENLKKDIREGLTGDSNNVDQTKDAVNPDQVAARFEARKAILSYWAAQLQKTHEEILSVVFGLRYGNSFVSLIVDYGTEFHLLSPAQAIADYKAARDAGVPMYQLSIRRKRVDKLLAGASESLVNRTSILSRLEPYPDLPLTSVPAGSDAWELKADFDNYIALFEADNVPVENFGILIPEGEKIRNILTQLYVYVSESKQQRSVPIEPGSGPNKQGFNGPN